LVARNGAIAGAVEEVFMGCANQAGEDNRNVARMALLLSGLPAHVPGVTVKSIVRVGLDAVAAAARAIRAGEIELAIAGGVESMTRAPFVMGKAERAFQRTAEIYDTTIGWRFVNARMKAVYGVDSMPETGENVAAEFKVSREDQDAFAFRSQQRAARAQDAGVFAEQIVPVAIPPTKGAGLLIQSSATSSSARTPPWRDLQSSSRWYVPAARSRPGTHRESTTVPRRCCWHPPRPSRSMG